MKRILTKEQRQALRRVFIQQQVPGTYRTFRRTVQYAFFDQSILVNVGPMWIGIEPDGYTHT